MRIDSLRISQVQDEGVMSEVFSSFFSPLWALMIKIGRMEGGGSYFKMWMCHRKVLIKWVLLPDKLGNH